MAAADAMTPRRRFWSRCKSSHPAPAWLAQPTCGGGTQAGLPTGYRTPSMQAPPAPYAAPPYAAPPYAAPPYAAPPSLRPTCMPPHAQLPPSPLSQPQSPHHSLTPNPSAEEEELMQLAMAMSVSESAAQHEEAAAVRSPQGGAPPLRWHSQPTGGHASHQQRHPRRAETLSDEALARALGDMYDEEYAQEQQLRELRGAELHALPSPASATRLGATPAAPRAPVRQSGAGPHQPTIPRPGAAQLRPPPRLGESLGAAAGAGPATAVAAPPPHSVLPERPPLPPIRTTAAASAPPLAPGSAALPAASRRPSPRRSHALPPLSPQAATTAPPSGWVAFEAANAPLPQPAGGMPAALSGAGPEHGVMQNPLSSFGGSAANSSVAPHSATAMGRPLQDGVVPHPVGQGGSSIPDALRLPTTPSHRQTPSRPGGDPVLGLVHSQQMPDLIQLQSPGDMQQPAFAASGSAVQGARPHLAPPAAARASDLRAASWPLPAGSGSGPPLADVSSHHRVGSSEAGGAMQFGGFPAAAAAATAGPLGQGVAALPLPPASQDSLQAQLHGPHEQQRAWWQQQQQQLLPAMRQGQEQGAAQQPQPLQLSWLPEQHPSEDAGQRPADSNSHAEFRSRDQPWWQQLQQQQQQDGQQQRQQPGGSNSHASMPQHPTPEAPPSQQEQPQQEEEQPPHSQLQGGCAVEQQHTQGDSSADSSGDPAAGSSGPAAGTGALWSAFFEFPEDSDLTDCHPALLQAARLQQEAAATIAAASAADPPGRISPGHWRAMHLDIAEAYTCPITQEVTEDPVVAADSFTYERSAITAWLRNHDTSPMTNAQLRHKEVIPNVAARSAIRTLREAGLLDAAPDD